MVSSEDRGERLTNLRLDISYDGTGFHGFARQPRVRTIQGEIEKALVTLIGEEVVTVGAGRTDAGVHARTQVLSFQSDADVDLDRVRRGVAGMVGPEIAVLALSVVPEDFDARFSASWRSYRYFIEVAPWQNPLRRNWTWHVGRSLDVDAMAQTAQGFLGEHDFASFCRAHEGRTTVRTIDEVEWSAEGTRLVFAVTAKAFCHQMVRSLVGFSVEVGLGRAPASSVGEVLAARDRSAARNVAPPHGLVLWEVGYG